MTPVWLNITGIRPGRVVHNVCVIAMDLLEGTAMTLGSARAMLTLVDFDVINVLMVTTAL